MKSLETVSQQSKTAYNDLDVLAETEAGTELHIREDSSCRIPALRLSTRDDILSNNQPPKTDPPKYHAFTLHRIIMLAAAKQ